ncbi:F-box/kelch-repeat protein At5g26960-like [Andrographis paniculata]|uniref:F-box/kelch-repeat protein At5g26960-like n=1 Tax=Andrographis paniculata TaxID=175694 RepID=UPI0021E6ED2A|nr:F-box/kelch-repeat protein At5g26960-like [Andrographis paniculata]
MSPRHFSWMLKSCFPKRQQPHQPGPISSAAAVATAAAPAPATAISSLPDDLVLEILVRVPFSTLARLPSVCRRWAYLLNSSAFLTLRRRNEVLIQALFSISVTDSAIYAAVLRLDLECDWNVSSFVPWKDNSRRPVPALLMFSHFRLVSVGRKVYIVAAEGILRCDTWTGTLASKAAMAIPRKKFAAAAVAGKILVAGGSDHSSAVEEYDPVTNSWRVVSESPRRRYGCIGASADGVFYVVGGLKIGQPSGNDVRPAAEAAHVYASSMDLYDVAAGVWLRSRTVPGGGCVMAACAADGDVYVLSSHAVELSFWRFTGSRRNPRFGEWRRIKNPPLPRQVSLDGRVRFSCVGVGKAVLMVQLGSCIDDLLRRSGRSARGFRDGLVLLYDCAADKWTRVPDLPELMRRAACVCVEC